MRIYKKCSGCNKEKLSIEFGKHKNRPDGLQPWCKQCNKKNTKQWYKDNNPEHRRTIRERKKKYKEAFQRHVISYLLTHPCIDCGETDPLVLDFDHRDPSQKQYSIGTLMNVVTGWDAARLKVEIAKCDVRCSNCHRRKTAKERGDMRYKLLCEMNGNSGQARNHR